ncbi:MAG: 4'-phosphopantetheinyl transferase superfamily protein [Flavobacteriaceae bacterium]|nr:4'-phosphopantetheinyl transferase superfamily protein [Flavobacteriaceae bacterium]
MPLHQSLFPDKDTRVLIWKITEPLAHLSAGITLKEKSAERLQGMQSVIHQKGFLSVRHLLQHLGYEDVDLSYDGNGKPYLRDGRHISITHSFEFSAVVVSSVPYGIDIEKKREKIVKIAHKFLDEKECEDMGEDIQKLTWAWASKESIYKIAPPIGISFKQHLRVHFDPFDETLIHGKLRFGNEMARYRLCGLDIDGFTCVFGREVVQ